MPLLLPPDLREWVPEDDMVHFVIEAASNLPRLGFEANWRGTGSAQYPPKMLLSLLIYCYANGVFSSRRIEAATWRDVAVRYLTCDTHPDHSTICAFRQQNSAAIHEAFLGVLKLARELRILKVGTISVDGTQIQANASKYKNVTYDRAGKLDKQLELDIAALPEKAESADRDANDDGDKLPDEVARREKLRAKMQQARERLEERAKARAEHERAPAGHAGETAHRRRPQDVREAQTDGGAGLRDHQTGPGLPPVSASRSRQGEWRMGTRVPGAQR